MILSVCNNPQKKKKKKKYVGKDFYALVVYLYWRKTFKNEKMDFLNHFENFFFFFKWMQSVM